jgi:phage shock protein PspC (stress-responsive transcriptional regulator)
MNKTVNANIAGLVFYIEESAYDLLQNYLKSIEANFGNAEERSEIMRDIESRIAELFQERNANRKEVVNLEDVEAVIAIMGKPEDYQSDEFEEGEQTQEQSTEQETYTTEKKLYRDEENAVIGGVCSGLGAYFGIDPVIVRVIFVMLVLFGLSGIFIYIILFFITPEAKTAADKLRMRGAPINVESIKQTAQEFKESVKDAAHRNNFGKKVSKTIEKGVQSSSNLARGIGKVVGFGMLVGGLFAMLILISVFIGDGGLISFWGDRHMMNVGEVMDVFYTSDFQSNLAYFSLLIVLFIPIIGMIYAGIKLLFDIKGTIKIVAISGTVLWILAIGIIAITSIPVGLEFKEDATVIESVEVPYTEEITINVGEDDIFSNNIIYGEYWESTNLMDVQEDKIYMGYPRLKIIESSKDSTFKIIVQKEAHGLTYKEAIINAESIEYDVNVQGNQITLDPYMTLNADQNFRWHDLEVIIRVPEGHSVNLGENIERILVPISEKNRESKERKSFENTTWKNDNDKMVFIDS